MTGPTLRLAAGLLVVLALAGCGKKGAPSAPKDEPNTYPRAYPYDPSKPSKPDPSAFPTMEDTNTDPTQPRSTE
jgi:predicted small lipoprotein YifL